MLTRLGATATPEDAVGLLLDCHERIRAFLAIARRIAAARPGEPGLAEAAASVVRYFTQALPLHAQDEEQSILPRLSGREPDVDDALAAMEDEHRAHEGPLAALVAACREVAANPARLEAVAPGLARTSAELDAHFVEHLQREETVVSRRCAGCSPPPRTPRSSASCAPGVPPHRSAPRHPRGERLAGGALGGRAHFPSRSALP